MRSISQMAMLLIALLSGSHVIAKVIQDDFGNLEGDHRREFVDITKVEVEEVGHFVSIKSIVAAPFPQPHTLLGLGMQFVYQMKSAQHNDPEKTPQITVSLTENGWDFRTENTAADNNHLQLEIITNSNDLTLLVPKTALTGVDQIELIASTANKPKWKPITSNPPILIELMEDDTSLETLPE